MDNQHSKKWSPNDVIKFVEETQMILRARDLHDWWHHFMEATAWCHQIRRGHDLMSSNVPATSTNERFDDIICVEDTPWWMTLLVFCHQKLWRGGHSRWCKPRPLFHDLHANDDIKYAGMSATFTLFECIFCHGQPGILKGWQLFPCSCQSQSSIQMLGRDHEDDIMSPMWDTTSWKASRRKRSILSLLCVLKAQPRWVFITNTFVNSVWCPPLKFAGPATSASVQLAQTAARKRSWGRSRRRRTSWTCGSAGATNSVSAELKPERSRRFIEKAIARAKERKAAAIREEFHLKRNTAVSTMKSARFVPFEVIIGLTSTPWWMNVLRFCHQK